MSETSTPTTNPTDLDLDAVAMGVVSNASEAVGARERLVERGWPNDDIFVYEDDEGAELLRRDGVDDDEQCHAVGHLISGHRLLALRAGEGHDLDEALSALHDLGVREPAPAQEWVAVRDTEFNQRVFNTGGAVAERSARSDEEREQINSREGEQHSADTDLFDPSPLAEKARREAAERDDADEDKGVIARVLDTDDDRGLLDRVRDRDPEVDEVDERVQDEAAERETGDPAANG